MAAHLRVGVLRHLDGHGTCLIPGLILNQAGGTATVLIEHDGAIITASVAADYAQPPTLPDTVTAWQPHWQRLEAAAARRPTPPAGRLTVTNVGPLAGGGRRATLHLDGEPVGAILHRPGGHPTVEPKHPARRARLVAELDDIARSHPGRPATLSGLLGALLDEHPTNPSRSTT